MGAASFFLRLDQQKKRPGNVSVARASKQMLCFAKRRNRQTNMKQTLIEKMGGGGRVSSLGLLFGMLAKGKEARHAEPARPKAKGLRL